MKNNYFKTGLKWFVPAIIIVTGASYGLFWLIPLIGGTIFIPPIFNNFLIISAAMLSVVFTLLWSLSEGTQYFIIFLSVFLASLFFYSFFVGFVIKKINRGRLLNFFISIGLFFIYAYLVEFLLGII